MGKAISQGLSLSFGVRGTAVPSHLTPLQPGNAKAKGLPSVPLVSINHHVALRCHPLPCSNCFCPSMEPVAFTLRAGDFLPFVYSNSSSHEQGSLGSLSLKLSPDDIVLEC